MISSFFNLLSHTNKQPKRPKLGKLLDPCRSDFFFGKSLDNGAPPSPWSQNFTPTHECDSHTVTEGVRYTPFRIPHRRGTAGAPQWFPGRLPVLPPTNASLFVSHTAGAPQWLPRRLPVLPPTNASLFVSRTAGAPQWLARRLPVLQLTNARRLPVPQPAYEYHYQCFQL